MARSGSGGGRAELVRSAATFVAATRQVRSLLASIAAEADREAAARDAELAQQRATALADLRRRADAARRRGFEQARRVAQALSRAAEAAPTTDPLAVAAAVRIGTARVGAGEGSVPLLVPLVGAANLQVVGDGGRADVLGLIRSLIRNAVAGTGPGQLAVTTVDPHLRGIHGPFAGLRAIDESLLPPPVTDERAVDDLLTALVARHQRIAGLVRGRAASLTELRQRTRQPVERYELVVFLDYPTAVSEQAAAKIASVMRDGPTYGISILLQYGRRPDEEPWRAPTRAPSDTLSLAGRLSWSRVEQLDLEMDPAPAEGEIARLVTATVEAARTSAAPALPLGELLPADYDFGNGRSVAGLAVPVGRAGPEVVTIGLGDPITQRHNILVTGAVGQGKSNLLQVLVHGLAARYGPVELELYLIDMREGVTFFPLAGSAEGTDWLPQARVVAVHTDREFALSVLKHLVDEFPTRAQALRRYDGTYPTFRDRDPDPMPRIVLVIDEFQVLFEQSDDLAGRAAATLEKLVRMGRGFGIHVVLASQAVSHLPALGARADVVFSQFPTRLALRNSRAESLVALDRDNDEASLLRFRGEAIVNHAFGRREDNQRFVVAAADEPTLARVRTAAWQRWRGTASAPIVFDGRRAPRLVEATESLRRLRRAVTARSDTRQAVLGRLVSVGQETLGAQLAPEPGRHVAILGAGTASAVGALQAAAVSLAVQHPAGDAQFTVVDAGLGGEHLEVFVDLLTRLGFPPDVHSGRNVTAALAGLAERVRDRRSTDLVHYVVAIGLDRASDLDPGSPGSVDPESLRDLLASGPNAGVHLLAWWSSPAVFERHRGFGEHTMPATLLALRMDQRTARDLMGPSSEWTGTENRALLYGPREHERPHLLVPFEPLDRATAAALLRTDWDG